MKPIYKSLVLETIALSATLSLKANVMSGEDTATQAVQAGSLEGLKVGLISPNVSGVRDLLASGEATLDESNIIVNINGLAQGVHRLQVSAVFGTQTVVLYALDITVPTGALESETQEFEDEIVVVSTIGDGDKSGADATVYAKDGDGNAHITTPLSIGNGTATSNGAIASGYAGNGASIQATSDGAIASGDADGEGASIQATSNGAIASGVADTDETLAASGRASQAFGRATKAAGDYQHVSGKFNVVDTDGDYALIVGNGTADDARSNAFAIDWNGNLVLFNAGTPVVLTPAKLAQLIA